jgi:hypothetical protein
VAPSSPLRRGLAVFHSRDHSYIELHPALMQKHDDWVAPSAANPVRSIWIKHYTNIVGVLDELRVRFFLGDTNERLHRDVRAAAAAACRLPLEERKKLVFKVLLPVPEGMRVGWGGEKEEAFRVAMRDVTV